MTTTNEQTRHASDQVASSARDPIDRWLDVFVRLLRVPKADARRIRDELEDHLRARVDDLMLTGHAEPEAVRTAVAELGETAELARQFQSASKPHRRLTMLAGSAIVSAGLITGAVLLSPAAPSPLQQQSSAVASLSDQVAAVTEKQPVFTADLAVDPMTGFVTLSDAVAAIEGLLDARVIPHYGPIVAQLGGTGADVEFTPPSLKGLTLEQGLQQLAAALELEEAGPLVVQPSGDAFELATQSFFDRRDAVLIEYDVTALLSPPEGPVIDPYEFKQTVTSLIEPELWGDIARLGMVSTTMIVNAHPRIHSQITDLIARIDARYDHQRRAQVEAERERNEGLVAKYTLEVEQYRESIAKVEPEMAEARQSRHAARERMFRLDYEMTQAEGEQIIAIQLDMAEAKDALQRAESRVAELDLRHERLESSMQITQGQIRSHKANLAALDNAEG